MSVVDSSIVIINVSSLKPFSNDTRQGQKFKDGKKMLKIMDTYCFVLDFIFIEQIYQNGMNWAN